MSFHDVFLLKKKANCVYKNCYASSCVSVRFLADGVQSAMEQPPATDIKPAESSCEEEEQIQKLFRKTEKRTWKEERHSQICQFPRLSGATKLIPISDAGA